MADDRKNLVDLRVANHSDVILTVDMNRTVRHTWTANSGMAQRYRYN